GQKNPSLTERSCDALMNPVNIPVQNLVRLGLGVHMGKTACHGRVAQRIFVGFIDVGREHGAPTASHVVAGYLEEICPRVRMGKVIPITTTHHLLEVVFHRKNDKAFGPCHTLESNSERFTDGASASIGSYHVVS